MSDSASARCEKQLDRILGFFPRVEAKASFLFAVDTGMLGFAVLNMRKEDFEHWYVLALALTFLALAGASVIYVFIAVFFPIWRAATTRSSIFGRSLSGRVRSSASDSRQEQTSTT
jgi:hypothetical protein